MVSKASPVTVEPPKALPDANRGGIERIPDPNVVPERSWARAALAETEADPVAVPDAN
jgi:hypothetical protein